MIQPEDENPRNFTIKGSISDGKSPIFGPNEETVGGLSLLKVKDVQSRSFKIGHRYQDGELIEKSAELVAVNNCKEARWVVVRLNELPEFICSTHKTVYVAYTKASETGRFKQGVVFARCSFSLGGTTAQGWKKTCGVNIYPRVEVEQIAEMRKNPDHTEWPVVVSEHEKSMSIHKMTNDPDAA